MKQNPDLRPEDVLTLRELGANVNGFGDDMAANLLSAIEYYLTVSLEALDWSAEDWKLIMHILGRSDAGR